MCCNNNWRAAHIKPSSPKRLYDLHCPIDVSHARRNTERCPHRSDRNLRPETLREFFDTWQTVNRRLMLTGREAGFSL
jgi:hypothetical protein